MSDPIQEKRILILVPAYNEGQRLPFFFESLEQIFTKAKFPLPLTITVLNDGSDAGHTTQMSAVAQSFSVRFKNNGIAIDFISFSKNRGKGAVLRDGFLRGMQSRQFEIIGFLDADGATHFEDVLLLIEYLMHDPFLDGIIGSRVRLLGKTVDRSVKRHMIGRVFATLVSRLLSIPIYDSQCGAKFFKTRILQQDMFEICSDNSWIFDLQMVVYLFRIGAKLQEYPVSWSDKDGSKVSVIRDSIKMFFAILRLRKSIKKLEFKKNFELGSI